MITVQSQFISISIFLWKKKTKKKESIISNSNFNFTVLGIIKSAIFVFSPPITSLYIREPQVSLSIPCNDSTVEPCHISPRSREFIKSPVAPDLKEMRILNFAILEAVNRVSRFVTSKIHGGTAIDSACRLPEYFHSPARTLVWLPSLCTLCVFFHCV